MKYGAPKNIISTWLKNKEKYLQAQEARSTGKVKKIGESEFDRLDHVVFRSFIFKRSQNIQIYRMLTK